MLKSVSSPKYLTIAMVACLALLPFSLQAGAASVTVTHWQHSSPARDEMVKTLAEEFMKENPDIQVNVEVFSLSDFLNKVIVSLVGGTGPDVVQVRSTWIPWLIESAALQPLSQEILPYDKITEDFVPGAIGKLQADGIYYALPTDAQSVVLFRQPHLFAEAGLNPKAPQTWDELVEAAKRIHRRNDAGKTEVMGVATGGYGKVLYTLMLQSGAALWDKEADLPLFNTPEAAKGLKFAADLVTEYGVEDRAFGSRWTAFRNEKLGMVYANPAMKGSFLRTHPNLEFETSEIPAPEVGGSQQALLTSWALAPTNKADNVAATKWIAYLQSAEAQQRWISATGELPTRWEVIKNPRNLQSESDRAIMYSMMKSVGVPWVADEMDSIIRAGWVDVTSGKKPVGAALEQAQQDAINAETESRKSKL